MIIIGLVGRIGAGKACRWFLGGVGGWHVASVG
jgi:hypothetical protein